MFSRQSHESRILWSQEMHEGTGSSATGSSGPRPSPVPALPTTSDSSSLCLWPDKHKSSSQMTASPSVLIMSGVRLRYPFHWTWPSQLCTVSSNWGWTKLWLVSSFKQQLTLNFMLSHSVVPDSLATPWTVAHQATLSMGFFRQEYWSGLPFSPPGDLPNPEMEPTSAALAEFFTAKPLGKPLQHIQIQLHSDQGDWHCLRFCSSAHSELLQGIWRDLQILNIYMQNCTWWQVTKLQKD